MAYPALMTFASFLSTPSARRATYNVYDGTTKQLISIHALREEGDRRRQTRRGLVSYFYPRPPRGGRPASGLRDGEIFHFYPRPPRGGRRICKHVIPRQEKFLSTPSARRATNPTAEDARTVKISIHALREEGDTLIGCDFSRNALFLSTPSARRATSFSLTAHERHCNFYPRPPRGGRQSKSQKCLL